MTPSSLREFRRESSKLVAAYPAEGVPARVAELMPMLLDDSGLLAPDQRRAPRSGYGRNEVFICPADGFSILAMVWPPGTGTPIHDHAAWCCLGVYEGVLRETHYRPVSAAHGGLSGGGLSGASGGRPPAAVTDVFARHTGDVTHLPVNTPNIHCIHNPTDSVAISIHVYGGNAQKLGPNVETIYSRAA